MNSLCLTPTDIGSDRKLQNNEAVKRIKKQQIVYIDFIKGFAAISVVLLHAFPRSVLKESFAYVHIWQAVPLFVFVSFFLFFRKLDSGISLEEYYSKKALKRVFRKVIIPFLLVQLLFAAINYFQNGLQEVKWMIGRGGDGRGSYYPYIYCQIWLIAPLFYLFLNKMKGNIVIVGGGILLLAVFCNIVVFSHAVPVRLESCIIVRYLFMSVIAWEWYKCKGNLLWRYILPIISILYWTFGLNHDLSPWIPTKGGWGSQQFPAFFYTFFLVFVLFKLTYNCGKVVRMCLSWTGKYSYYIFLMQMLFFKLFTFERYEMLCGNYLSDGFWMRAGYVICALVGSIIPIFLYDIIKTTKLQFDLTKLK